MRHIKLFESFEKEGFAKTKNTNGDEVRIYFYSDKVLMGAFKHSEDGLWVFSMWNLNGKNDDSHELSIEVPSDYKEKATKKEFNEGIMDNVIMTLNTGTGF